MAIVLNVEPLFISPYVFACWVTLNEKKLPFDVRQLDAAKGETRTTDYMTRTITGRVPSLEHDGFGVAESTAIIEYLEDAFPQPAVLPREPRDRARCRQLMSWLRSDDTLPIREERPTTTIFYEPVQKPLSDTATTAVDKLFAVGERLIRAGQPNLFGDWTIVDAELAFMLHRLILTGDAVPERVRVWAEAQWQRPTVQAYCKLPRPKR